MEFMTWTSDLSVGVEVLDDDHKKLIGIINQLHYGITAGHDREVLEAVLNELVEYIEIPLCQGRRDADEGRLHRPPSSI